MICEACKRADVKTECEHMKNHAPPWSSEEDRSFVKRICGDTRAGQYQREIAGIRDSGAGPESVLRTARADG